MLLSRTLKVGMLVLSLTVPVLAQADAVQDAAIKELTSTLGIDGMLPGLAQRTSASAMPLLQEYFVKNKISLSKAQQQKAQEGLKAYVDGVQKVANDYFASPAVKQQFAKNLNAAYSAQFSAEELKQINAFYKTAAGQKLLKQQPQILNTLELETLKQAEPTLLPKMRSAAEAYGKRIAKK
ncbi:DUF2059 domain-containing protein [Neisseriaceae bacterium TC5R-5]|nr:DUF2059 domain-containing protein [Neisseriaceae bacterium TC5R-5]